MEPVLVMRAPVRFEVIIAYLPPTPARKHACVGSVAIVNVLVTVADFC